MKKSNKNFLYKFIFLIIIIIIIIALMIACIPTLKRLYTPENKIKFQNFASKNVILGFLILFALELLQILLAFLPGEPIEIMAGICYGSFWGTILLLGSIFIATLLIYKLTQKFGHKFVYFFVGKDKIDQIENSDIYQNPKGIEMLLFILFIIPATPKDFLVYVGALLPIKMWRFILIATFARIPSIVSSTIAGSSAFDGDWKKIILVYAITFILSFVIIILTNLFDKNKVTKNAIKVIK